MKIKSKFLICCTAACMVLGLLTAHAASKNQKVTSASDITIKVDGSVISFPDQKPVVQNNRTLVPIRFAAEALGYSVEWHPEDSSVSIEDGTILLYPGTNKAVIHGNPVTLDVNTAVIQERTMVPLRVIAETLNCSVDWVQEKNMVLINAKNAEGRELSLYDRLIQTDLFYDIEDIRSEYSRFLVSKKLLKKAPAEAAPCNLDIGWWIEAPMTGYDDCPEFDGSICGNNYSPETLRQIKDVLQIVYPTGYEEVSSLLKMSLRGELWETNIGGGYTIRPGTIGWRYLDDREVCMSVSDSSHYFSIAINTLGYVNPQTPTMISDEDIVGYTRDYQLGLWKEDFEYLNLEKPK